VVSQEYHEQFRVVDGERNQVGQGLGTAASLGQQKTRRITGRFSHCKRVEIFRFGYGIVSGALLQPWRPPGALPTAAPP
jgi:hypothetical protein